MRYGANTNKRNDKKVTAYATVIYFDFALFYHAIKQNWQKIWKTVQTVVKFDKGWIYTIWNQDSV